MKKHRLQKRSPRVRGVKVKVFDEVTRTGQWGGGLRYQATTSETAAMTVCEQLD